MAAVDILRSLQASSDEGSFQCSPCEYRGLDKTAMHYCLECEEYLCESCESIHKSLRQTRNHEILSGNLQESKKDSAKLKTDNKVLCSCTAKEVTMYCKKHNDVLCVDCNVLKHRTCLTSSVREASASFRSNEGGSTLTRIRDLKQKLMALHDNRTQDLATLMKKTSDCRENVQSFKAGLISKLDLMEEKSLSEIDKYKRVQGNTIEQHLEACSTALNKIESGINSFEKAKKTDEETLLFLYNLQLSKTTDNFDKLYTDVSKEVQEPNIEFEPEQRINIADLLSLGSIKTNKTRTSESEKVIADMYIKSSRKLDCKITSDSSEPSLSGSMFLPTGQLVLCDYDNSTIKLLNEDFTLRDSIELPDKPWDISLINDVEAITTIEENKLQFVQILPNLKLGRTLQLDKECLGIDVYHEHIYVSFRDGEIRVIDHNGTTKKTVGQNCDGTFRFKNPLYMAVARTGSIYISDSVTKDAAIHCISPDGNVRYSYQDPELILSEGIYVDKDGSILACSHSSHNMHVIDKSGKKKKILLTESDGLKFPRSIAFRPTDNTLAVATAAKGLLVFEME